MKRLNEESKNTAANKLNDMIQQTDDPAVAAILLQALDMMCDAHQIEMPEEAISANIGLDDYFGCDVLTMR